jgi:uncharacterized protein (TIGR00725 family)
MTERRSERRPIISVVGSSGTIDSTLEQSAEAIGEKLIDHGFRIVCGGRTGVMSAVSRGAKRSARAGDGDVIGILPGYDESDANESTDIVIPTGLGFARNTLVVSAGDIVLGIKGGAGTLSEIAMAWQIERPTLVWKPGGGWSATLAGKRIDDRHDSILEGFDDIDQLIERARELARTTRKRAARWD